jgi:hypothetical protein
MVVDLTLEMSNFDHHTIFCLILTLTHSRHKIDHLASFTKIINFPNLPRDPKKTLILAFLGRPPHRKLAVYNPAFFFISYLIFLVPTLK